MDYKKERINSTYVEFDLIDETNLLGKYLHQINIQNDKGVEVTVFYYLSGINKFDKITNYEPFYEYGLSFHLLSYENAFIFRLYHDKKQICIGKFGIWRDTIIDNPKTEFVNKEVIYNNQFLGALKSGAFGSGAGLIGTAISIGSGNLISKLVGLKTENTRVELFHLQYRDKDRDSVNTIKIYKKDEYDSDHFTFMHKHYRSNLDEETIISPDSRCFIATACYGSDNCDELIVFRNFRDKFLLKSYLGRQIIILYYKISPYLIQLLGVKSKKAIKIYFLDKIYRQLESKYYK